MTQKYFIPITDEMLYDHPEQITSTLRPYNFNTPCFHWMAEIEIVEEEEELIQKAS